MCVCAARSCPRQQAGSGQSHQKQQLRLQPLVPHAGPQVAANAYAWWETPSLRASSFARYYLRGGGGGENRVVLSFRVCHPRSREDGISPRKQFLCEVWVPEMSITSLEVPQGPTASEGRGTEGWSATV